MSLREKLDDLTPEQKEKALNVKTPEEILEFANKEGYELSIDELDAASGGWGPAECPKKVSDS